MPEPTMPIQLGIALPAYGSKIDVGHAGMWLGFGIALAHTSAKFALRWHADYHINGIDLCRNMIVWDAIEAGCDWVLMVDADTFHRPANVDAIGDVGVDMLQMIIDGHRRDAAMIGAPCRSRQVNNPVIVVHDTDFQQMTESQLRGNIVEVSRMGAAFIAVNLGWLKDHWPQAPWFLMDPTFEDGRPRNKRGEDYWFCDGVRERGGKVLCDGRFVVEHVAGRQLVKSG